MPNVRIVPFMSWQMHNNVIHAGIQIVHTKYVYVIEHDEAFLEAIDHKAMIAAMEERPDEIRKIEFNRNNNTDCKTNYFCRGQCSDWNWTSCNVTSMNGIQLTKTSGWSDQAHFTTKKYYEEVLRYVGTGDNCKKHPEDPMLKLSHSQCERWGAHFYGNFTGGMSIMHYIGREAQNKFKAKKSFEVANSTVQKEIVRVSQEI